MDELLKACRVLRMYAPDGDGGKGTKDGADKKQDDGKSAEGNHDEGKKTPEIPEELKKYFADELKKSAEETNKAWQSKFDQKNTELQKALKILDEEKKKSMTAEEISIAEQKKKDEALAEKEKTVLEMQKKLWRSGALQWSKLPNELAGFLGGETEEDIKKNAEELNKYVNSLADQRLLEKLKAGYQPAGQTQGGAGTPIEKRFEGF